VKFLLLDTETTGLNFNKLIDRALQSRIIEFYACVIDEDAGPEPVEELEFICNPGVKLDKIITKITGLTDYDVRDRQPFSIYSEQVASFLKQGDAVVAHNLGFDMAMVENEFSRLPIKEKLTWPAKKICTVQQTEHLKGHRLSLTDLHVHLFGKEFPESHRAKNDVLAMARCLLELRRLGEI
jgi:DNA polymerase III epsilon subunit-like protein